MSNPFVPTTDTSDGGVGGGIDSGNISLEEFQQQFNGTRLTTPSGYEFAPSDKDIPKITPAGVFLTAAQAEDVLSEADGLIPISAVKASEIDEDVDDPDLEV